MQDFAKLYAGEKIAGISAALLFLAMFLTWFGTDVSGAAASVDLGSAADANAWDALEYISIFLLVTVVLTLANLSLRLSNFDYEPPGSPNFALALFAAAATLLILYRIVSPPDFGEVNGIVFESTLKFGAFLGLLAAAGVTFGSFRAYREERAA